MCPLGGNDIGDIINAAHSGDYSGLATLGDDNTATLLSTELTNMANIQAARQTNDANKALHQMDNEFNAQQAELARNFQRQMRNEDREYNDPSNVKARMMAAGLNPMSLTGLSSQPLQSSTPSTTAASAASPIAMQSPQLSPAHVSPYSARGVDIAASLTNVANAGKGFADTMVALRNVRNNEASQRSQSLLNMAKAVESTQSAANLKQQHDVLTPTNVLNIFSQIKQREHQNSNLDAQSDLYKSNVALNDSKREEIRQAIVESNARIDNMRKQLGWQYYNTNVTAGKSWSGIISRIAEGSGIMQDVTEAVRLFKEFVKNSGDPKKQVSAACDFVTELGSKAIESGSEKLSAAYATFYNALPVFIQKWAKRWDAADARYRKQALDYMNSSNSSVLNPFHGDTYSGQ